MRKLDKMANVLHDEFREHLAAAMAAKFDGLEVETHANIWQMRLVTTRADGEDFTPEQMTWMEAWSEGYSKALELVRAHAMEAATC